MLVTLHQKWNWWWSCSADVAVASLFDSSFPSALTDYRSLLFNTIFLNPPLFPYFFSHSGSETTPAASCSFLTGNAAVKRDSKKAQGFPAFSFFFFFHKKLIWSYYISKKCKQNVYINFIFFFFLLSAKICIGWVLRINTRKATVIRNCIKNLTFIFENMMSL